MLKTTKYHPAVFGHTIYSGYQGYYRPLGYIFGYYDKEYYDQRTPASDTPSQFIKWQFSDTGNAYYKFDIPNSLKSVTITNERSLDYGVLSGRSGSLPVTTVRFECKKSPSFDASSFKSSSMTVYYPSSWDTSVYKQYGGNLTWIPYDAKFIQDAVISEISPQPYSRKGVKPPVTVRYDDVTLTEGTDYLVTYGNNYALGTATITVTGIGDYIGKTSTTFEIQTIPVTDLSITDIPEQTYTGSALKPPFTVTNGTITLIEETHYTVSYSDNIGPGVAHVTITGKGEYTGSVDKEFQIVGGTTVTGVSFKEKSLIKAVHDSFAVPYEISPDNAVNQEVEWSSSHPDVVSVDEAGQMNALKVGESEIRVTTKDGSFSDTAQVQVYLLGDLDRDGLITTIDIGLLRNIVVSRRQWTDLEFKTGNLDGGKVLDSVDVSLLINQYIINTSGKTKAS